eukprot:4292632-Pyramimonas_sp.AAC.1
MDDDLVKTMRTALVSREAISRLAELLLQARLTCLQLEKQEARGRTCYALEACTRRIPEQSRAHGGAVGSRRCPAGAARRRRRQIVDEECTTGDSRRHHTETAEESGAHHRHDASHAPPDYRPRGGE